MAEKSNRRLIVVLIVLSMVIALGGVLLVMAFVLAGQTGFEGKTLWDWMNLALAPAMLAGIAGVVVWWLDKKRTETERASAKAQAETEQALAQERAETERSLALDRTREDRMQVYLDRMQDLLEKGLKSPPSESGILREVARTRTLTVLRGLDSERNVFLLQFLRDSELITGDSPVISLENTNLSGADLIRADLSGTKLIRANLIRANLSLADLKKANLNEANLSRAGLNEANLIMADLRRANLSGAGLSGANLGATNLIRADLRRADLRRTNLIRADLSGADLSGADLSGAILSGANLSGTKYNDRTKWPDGFDPISAGAKKVEPKPSDDINADESKPA